MNRYHVTDDGRVLPCSASVKNCSYSNAEDGNRHFNNIEEAEQKSAELLLNTYDQFHSVSKKNIDKLSPRVRSRAKTASIYKGYSMDLDSTLETDRFARVPELSHGSNFQEFRKKCHS